ncbi:unannotated protein [freshwater metagenome]|jgi:hypothetical protein|uniref:Unannotated protein n=1 Tax=freshwater metagenome TaxID=449393 RepID=A0A6J7BNT5_9ZZZZ|nr:hypothetical protein [Actinomycetota bacterium]MSY10352.1 hypothetical protein [Actinomycetota bacterium]MSY55448.1 hypothetical protein [Actinomycetota bacterium]TRZ85633.1 MAG: hypothetical protein D4R83_06360 [Streptomycetaceae bacterium]
MAEVDPKDTTIKSYTVRHHRFDQETNHFRWFDIKSFDNEKEMLQLINLIELEIERRNSAGEGHHKEQVAGSIYDPEWAKENKGWTAYEEMK